jgi:uncharacterized RDD family membrane protein YckC
MRKTFPLYSVPVCKKCYYKLANRRQLAFIIDYFALMIVAFLFYMVFATAAIAVQMGEETEEMIGVFVVYIVLPLLFLAKDGFAGHSLGKLVCGVMVVDRRSFKPIGFGRSFIRNLPLLIPFVALILAFLLPRGYRWGDGWAGTKVIWKKYTNHPVFTGQLACENCQYDLTANTSGVCPECGMIVPPAHG